MCLKTGASRSSRFFVKRVEGKPVYLSCEFSRESEGETCILAMEFLKINTYRTFRESLILV